MKKTVYSLMLLLIILAGCGQTPATPLATSDNEVCGLGEGCTLSKESFVGYNVGDQMPNVTLTSADGTETELYDLVKGHDRFILSLSADWCSDCGRQNRKLSEYYNNLEDMGYGAAVMYINYSSADGTHTTNEEQMINFINDMEYTFPAFYDKDGAFVSEYGPIYAVPYNFILDENAIIKGITSEIDADNLFLDNSEQSRI